MFARFREELVDGAQEYAVSARRTQHTRSREFLLQLFEKSLLFSLQAGSASEQVVVHVEGMFGDRVRGRGQPKELGRQQLVHPQSSRRRQIVQQLDFILRPPNDGHFSLSEPAETQRLVSRSNKLQSRERVAQSAHNVEPPAGVEVGSYLVQEDDPRKIAHASNCDPTASHQVTSQYQ